MPDSRDGSWLDVTRDMLRHDAFLSVPLIDTGGALAGLTKVWVRIKSFVSVLPTDADPLISNRFDLSWLYILGTRHRFFFFFRKSLGNLMGA